MAKLSQWTKDHIVPIIMECKEKCTKEKTVFYEQRRIHVYLCWEHAHQIATLLTNE